MKKLRSKLAEIVPIARTFAHLVRGELILQLQLVGALVTIMLAWIAELTRIEWLIVLLTIGTVLAVELINCAIEELCDHVTPEMHPQIAFVKESAAAASAVIGVFAIAVGLMIFIPHLANV